MGSLGRALYSIGFWIRETGQAIDRLGCALQGTNAYKEQLSRHRAIMNLMGKRPNVPPTAFVAPSASVIGDVEIGPKSSIWYGAVLRGDVNSIKVGSMTNIQDGSIVHVAKTNISGNVLPTIIGSKVTIGHNAILHACTVEDEAFVGMGSTLLDGVKVEKGAMVAAGSLVTQKTKIPAGEIWAGNPAKFLRKLSAEETAFITKSAESYFESAQVHAEENAKSFEQIEADKEARAKDELQSDDYDSHIGVIRKKELDTTPTGGTVTLR